MKFLIAGGAGFIGSNISEIILRNNHEVTIIDGIMPETGGDLQNIASIKDSVNIIKSRIEDVPNLENLLNQTDVVIDCMGWTSHIAGLENPSYDLELNTQSHLAIISALKLCEIKPRVIYLGSTVQYGKITDNPVTEDVCCHPLDIQGINKLAAESMYRVYSAYYDFDVTSLIIPNCFGKHQKVNSSDIGLIGSFIKDAMAGKVIEVYGNSRNRNIIYSMDLAKIVLKLSLIEHKGFQRVNTSGYFITINKLAEEIVASTQNGEYKYKEIPENIKKIDNNSIKLDTTKLESIIGEFQFTDMSEALKETIVWFRSQL